MSIDPLEAVLHHTMAVARETGNLLRRGFGEVKRITNKSSSIDLVTEYDTAAEELILARLASRFPDHGWVAEEGGEHSAETSPYLWYVDPLDGTNNFAHGYPIFAVSLALYEGEHPLVAVVHEPLRDDYFYAVAGQGAFLRNGESSPQTIEVSTAAHLEHSLLATGFPYDRHTSKQDNLKQFAAFLKHAQGVRRSGSAALDLAAVAAGRLDGFWELKLSRWDVAAGRLLVQEAGGHVTDLSGHPLRLNSDKVNIVAANPRLQPQMLALLSRVGD